MTFSVAVNPSPKTAASPLEVFDEFQAARYRAFRRRATQPRATPHIKWAMQQLKARADAAGVEMSPYLESLMRLEGLI